MLDGEAGSWVDGRRVVSLGVGGKRKVGKRWSGAALARAGSYRALKERRGGRRWGGACTASSICRAGGAPAMTPMLPVMVPGWATILVAGAEMK